MSDTLLTGTQYDAGSLPNNGTATDFGQQPAIVFDGDTSVTYLRSGDGASAIDLGSGQEEPITKLRAFPRPSFASAAIGMRFQGSNDGSSWTTLFTVASIVDGWNEYIPVDTTTPYRYLRYYHPSPPGGVASINEVEFYTGDPPPPVLEIRLKGNLLAAGSTLDLGTWPVGADVAIRLRLLSTGADLSLGGVAPSGTGSLVTTGLVGMYTNGTGADVVLKLSCGSAGTAKSFTLTFASDDAVSPSYAVTFTYDVQQDTNRTLSPHASATATPGSGFSNGGGSGVAIPTASGTPHGSGFDAYAPAACSDIHGFDWVDGGSLYWCVATDTSDIGDIDYVDFFHEGVSKRIYTKALSPRTGVEGFLIQLTRSTDGASDAYAKIVPVNGLEVVVTCRVYFNPLGTLLNTTSDNTNVNTSGDLSAAIATVAAAGGGYITLTQAGNYVWSDVGSNAYPAKPVIVRLGGGLSAGDAVISRASRGAISIHSSKLLWRSVRFETSLINQYVGLGNNLSNDPRAGTKFERCKFIDVDGVTGPARGYTTIDGSLQQLFFAHDRDQPYYCEGCEAVTYNGLCGATCVVNGSVTASFDGLYVAGTAANGFLYGNVDFIEAGRMLQRAHVQQTLTVASKSGTGPTVLTFSGNPTLQDGLTSSNGAYLTFLTGALAGQTFDVTATDDTANTITVSGNASAAAASDTAWCFLYAHPDIIQMADTSNINGVILNRVRSTIDWTEMFRLDRLDNSKIIRGVWFQSCLTKLAPGAGSGNVAAWEADQRNCGFRQSTFPRAFVPESDGDTSAFDVAACGSFDCIWPVVQGNPTDLVVDQTKFRIDNNHFITTSRAGSSVTGPASANLDASGYPQGGSPVLNRLYGARLRFDAYGQPISVDGSGAIGGAQPHRQRGHILGMGFGGRVLGS